MTTESAPEPSNETPWAILHPALSEHDPVIYRLPYDRKIHDDVDPVAEAVGYLRYAAERHALDTPKKVGRLMLAGLDYCCRAYANYPLSLF